MVLQPGGSARRRAPVDADALGRHDLLGFSHPDTLKVWSLVTASGASLHVQPTLMTTSGETQRQLAIQGMGIALMSEFMTAKDVAQGRLVEVLPHATQHSKKPVNAMYYKQSAVSARIASMADYVVAAMAGPERHWICGPEKQKPTG